MLSFCLICRTISARITSLYLSFVQINRLSAVPFSFKSNVFAFHV